MILFLYGQDTYRLQQKLREIEQHYRKVNKTGLNLEKLDATQMEFQEFRDSLFQQSMFIKKKLFFLENIFSSLPFREEFLVNIESLALSPHVIVCFEKNKVDRSDKLFKALKEKAKCQEFSKLQKNQLKEWIQRECQVSGATIERAALTKLIDFVGNNLWQLQNELKKLVSFTKTITLQDVELLIKPKIEPMIFETIEVLAQRDKIKALRLVENHLEKGENPLYLLKMIIFQFRNLLVARTLRESGRTLSDFLRLQIAKPYPTKKAWQQSQSFSLLELKKIYREIFEADLAIKTGKISPEEGLRMLLVDL